MLVKEIMNKNVRSCREGATLNDAAQIMWDEDCGALPVLDAAGKVVGMVTDRDIAMCAYTQGTRLTDTLVSCAMANKVITCSPGDTVAKAEQIMRDAQVRRLPVVDARQQLVGILSLDDIVRAVVSAPSHAGPPHSTDVIRTMASIYRPRRQAEARPGERAPAAPAPSQGEQPRAPSA